MNKHQIHRSPKRRGYSPSGRLKPSSRNPLAVRPIGSRPLKSVMDTLRPYLPGQRILDLFAGRGRLGISALQEGADSAVFVECHRPTLNILKQDALKLASACEFVCMDVFSFLRQEHSRHETYSLVFADPPFSMWHGTFEENLFSSVLRILRPGAIFLVKHPARMLPFASHSGFRLWKESEFGESRLSYFRYEHVTR